MVGQVTNAQKSVRRLLPFFGRASVINRQYTHNGIIHYKSAQPIHKSVNNNINLFL